jgi:hypothetical protein
MSKEVYSMLLLEAGTSAAIHCTDISLTLGTKENQSIAFDDSTLDRIRAPYVVGTLFTVC